MKGESAYVGHLWLAALRATREMGEELAAAGVTTLDGLDVRETITRYGAWFDAGRPALEKLWDEAAGYYHIDAQTDDIMTDQLFGAWYAAMTGVGRGDGVSDRPGGTGPPDPPDDLRKERPRLRRRPVGSRQRPDRDRGPA